ncbi:MAG: hypothetical protein ACUVSY_15895 [Roseiflexus sp.]
MHRAVHRSFGGAIVFALIVVCLLHLPAHAASKPSGSTDGIIVATDGSMTLTHDAPPEPSTVGGIGRFGTFVSDVITSAVEFDTLRVEYTAQIPRGAQVAVDVRTGTDGNHWAPWVVDLASNARAHFDRPARFVQYRIRMLATGASPTLHSLRLIPERATPSFTAFEQEQPPIAPTFTVHATRLGLVGRRTANGHRIVKRDRFVALPCVCVLSSRGGSEYMVRVTYQGRSAVAPVYDVGPWNTHDNYWDPQEQRYFSDLRQGWPQDHAAFFDGHNNGRARHGRVRFPTAIDIADGIWWDDLGIKGDRAVVEVTFLWMGRDPLEEPPELSPNPGESAEPQPDAITPLSGDTPPSEEMPSPDTNPLSNTEQNTEN